MIANDVVAHRRLPSVFAYMAGALLPSRGLRPGDAFPRLGARLTGFAAPASHLADYRRLTATADDGLLPFLYPQVLAFPLVMSILTRPRFPLPIWHALQIRNHLLARRPIGAGEPMDIATDVAAHRVLDKGLEVDLRTRIGRGGDVAWEGVTSFYYRGRYGGGDAPPPEAATPEVDGTTVADWRMDAPIGWRFGRLTGDFNGLHWSDRYARRFGFRRAFHHPAAVLGRALNHLDRTADPWPRRLDVWLKGPVFYRSAVTLDATGGAADRGFALRTEADPRPAVLGRWRCGAAADQALTP